MLQALILLGYIQRYLSHNLTNFGFLGALELKGNLHKHGLSLSPTKESLILSNRMILVASLYRHDDKLRGQETPLAIEPYTLKLCGMWRLLIETTYSPSCILQ